MRPLCCSKLLLSVVLLSLTLWGDERYAFIYSTNLDDRFINFYDKVVVEADAIDNIYALRYPDKMVAYVSVGEIEPWRKSLHPYDPSWVISENRTWHSRVADLTQKGYQTFLLNRFKHLYQQGYRHFFLDTMDAYHVTRNDPQRFKTQQRALIQLIHTIHQHYPHAKLIANRGFELLPAIHTDIHAVVAESLFSRYDHAHKTYRPVPKADREWLLDRFREAQAYHLDVVSIDYTDQNRSVRHALAQKIKKLGIIPYVTDGLLHDQGECHIPRLRREVLILFNQSLFKDNNPAYSNAHLLASMPLEHLGYVPLLYDISTQPLPSNIDDRYHGVIVWVDAETPNSEKIYAFTQKAKAQGVKVLFLNHFGFKPTPKRLKTLGITQSMNHNEPFSPTQTTYHAGYQPFEMPASIAFTSELLEPKDAHPILTVTYENGQRSTPLARTSWGGYALGNAFLISVAHEHFWTIDPFRFFKETLALDTIPVPDPTTEAGRRILLAHVDGDGFMQSAPTASPALAPEYLQREIYQTYLMPHTLSLIEGEFSLGSLPTKQRLRMKRIAKRLYAMPWIQPAGHTFSHPLSWHKTNPSQQHHQGMLIQHHSIEAWRGDRGTLPLPSSSHYDPQRETVGSVNFALSFAPLSKQIPRVLFWSGDCLPTKELLAYTERHQILTMNGGDTTITKHHPWLSHISPFGLQHQAYWQVYNGAQSENAYTNNWLGPFWGYRDVIDTFTMTEQPRRLKPIEIYYHIYSGSKLASLNALKSVYRWANQQKTSQLYADQYIQKVHDFYHTAIAKWDQGYEIRNQGELRTLRVDYPIHIDLQTSQGVAGYRHLHQRTYITLDQRHEHRIQFSNQTPNLPYLLESNGWVKQVEYTPHKITFDLQANRPLQSSFYLPPACQLPTSSPTLRMERNASILTLESEQYQGATVVFKCQ